MKRLLVASFLLTIFLTGKQLKTQPESHPKNQLYLAKSLHFYKQGDWKKAYDYLHLWKHTRSLSEKTSANGLKLEFLLLLAASKEETASDLIIKYLKRRPSPFWFYYIGTRKLENRRYKEAEQYFYKALLYLPKKTAAPQAKTGSKESGTVAKKSSMYAPSLMPLLCRWPLPPKSPLRAALPRPFAQKEHAYELWNRKLSNEEALVSAYLLAVLSKIPARPGLQASRIPSLSNKKRLEISSELAKQKAGDLDPDSLVLFTKIGLSFLRDRKNPSDPKKLTSKKNQKMKQRLYENCLRVLRFQKKEDLSGRLLRPYDKQKINRFIGKLLFFRALDIADPRSLLAYVDFLLSRKRPHEALYVLRELAARQELFHVPDLIKAKSTKATSNRLRLLAATLVRLSKAYELLGQKEDALSSLRLKQRVLRYKNSFAKNPNSQHDQERFLQEIFRLSGENLMHRESLLFLYYLTESPAKKEEIQKRIKKRDLFREKTELPYAFSYFRKIDIFTK